MSIRPASTHSEILAAARARHGALIEEFARGAAPDELTAAFCQRARSAVERYNAALLDELMRAGRPHTPADAISVRDGYMDVTLEFARAVCNTAGERTTRHAVAQAVQCALLDYELHLRASLDMALTPST